MQAFPDFVGAGLWSKENQFLVWRGDKQFAISFEQFLAESSTDEIRVWQIDEYVFLAAAVEVQATAEHVEAELSLVSPSSQQLGYALLVFSKERLQQQIGHSLLISLVAVVIAALIIVLIISNWVQKITLPLRLLSDRMQSEDFLQQAKASITVGSSEIQHISQAYNQMAVAITERDEALRLHQHKLEVLVEIRTRELITARDAALSASRHKSEFLANISHELRTPLQSVIGYIDLVNERLEFTEFDDLTSDLNRAQRNAGNLLRMINSLLDLSKIEAGKMELHLGRTSISQLVHQCVELIQPLLLSNKLLLEICDKDIELLCDEEKILQVLVNLMSNACKFTQSGSITLRVDYDDRVCMFSIIDTGIGIEAQHLDRIFTPFYQIDGSQSRRIGGTGLGLAITKQFVDLMGGTISVQSKPQLGSLFIVKVPILDPNLFNNQ
jgi:signal transduction histidine kinase